MLRVTSEGGIPLDKIHEAISNQDFSALKELQTKISVRDGADLAIDKFTGTVQALNDSKNVISMGNTLGLYDPLSHSELKLPKKSIPKIQKYIF